MGLSATFFKRKKMPKLKLFKEKPPPKAGTGEWQDANDMFSTSPNSKQQSRMYTAEELQAKGKPHAGKYR